MATFNVTQATDNGRGDVAGSLSWAILQANQTAGDDIISIDTNVRLELSSDLKRMQTLLNSNITIQGNGNTISGDNDNDGVVDENGEDRPVFFIKSGDITIENLTITGAVAKGGDSTFGGAGAGMGGALFIYDGNVTVNSVTFDDNRAIGGDSGPGAYGGGGMGGSSTGFGGGGLFGNDNGSYGGYGGNGNYGGGGQGTFGTGGGFGIAGGFGGGGGDSGGAAAAGDGGFGGGGGFGFYGVGGNGGFGAGGGGSNIGSPGQPGYGASGSFGAGMGGAIFIRSGNLTINDSTFTDNQAKASEGAKALGGGIFKMETLDNGNGNNQGMPTTLPTVTINNTTFTGNVAVDSTMVTNTNDSGPGSLREALLNSMAGEGDIITFDASLSGQTITLTSQLEIINNSITIDGDIDDNGTPDITISGGDLTRVFYIFNNTENRDVSLDGLIIENGTIVSNVGGGIYNIGATLTVSNSIIRNNTTTGDNSAGGGGIANYGGGNVTIINSILSGNTGLLGGGAIRNYGSTVNLINSTISGNTALDRGTEKQGGGGVVNVAGGQLNVINSIIAGNTASFGQEIAGGGVLSSSNNVYGDSSKTNAEAFSGFTPSGTDITATSDGTMPTALGSLVDTSTYSLVPNSPAIDAGDNNANIGTKDIQGSDRIYNATVDIGANEYLNAAPVITPSQSSAIDENTGNGATVYTVVATDLENNSLSNWTITDGNTDGAFAIDPNTGVITVANSTALDFETNPSFTLTLTVSDGADISDPQTITLNLNDVNEGSSIMGETGTISNLNHLEQTITLNNDYINPVIFVQPVSFNGNQTAIARITNINAGSSTDTFTVKIQETSNLDGAHVSETLSYFVFEEGTWELADGTKFQVGSFDTDINVKDGFINIPYNTEFDATPSVFTQVQTNNDTDFVRTRQKNVNGNYFQVGLEKEESLQQGTPNQNSETIGWLAIEQGSGTWDGSPYQIGNTGVTVTHSWFSQDLTGFTSAPELMASLSTYNGRDSAGLRYSNLSETGFEVKVQEDQSFDNEMGHLSEAVDFFALAENTALTAISVDTKADQAIGEFGVINDLTHLAQTIQLINDYTNPVVFVQPLSFNGSETAIARIIDINASGSDDTFTVQIQETSNWDNKHLPESVSYFVFEAGEWTLDDGNDTLLKVGTLNASGEVSAGFETVGLSDYTDTPVVLSQVQTNNDSDFVRTRMTNINSTGFEVGLEEEEASKTSDHDEETIGWLAIASGNGTWNGNPYQAGNTGNIVDHTFTNIAFEDSLFNQKPQFAASLATYNGQDAAGLRYTNLGATGVDLKVEEDITLDNERVHVLEGVNFLALQGSGILTGTAFFPMG